MPVLATAVAAGKTAFSLIPKTKEGRKKAGQALQKGFSWVKGALGKVQSIQKNKEGYTVTTKSGETYTAKGFGKPSEAPESNELMKYAPYIIGALILLTMNK
jgi:hypothetical protein